MTFSFLTLFRMGLFGGPNKDLKTYDNYFFVVVKDCSNKHSYFFDDVTKNGYSRPCHSQISVSFLTIIQGKLNPQNKVSSKLFLLCQIVISDNKLENCDDSSAYTRILSLERLLIFKRISCKRQTSLSVHLLVIRGRRNKFLKLLWGGSRQRHIQT